jgi:hypothetical protein
MAHFAKISEDNIVLYVSTFDNKDMIDENGNSVEAIGQAYLEKHNNWPAHLWIQTSYNTRNNKHLKGGTPLRGNFAGIGSIWDPVNQIFYPSKPYSSWSLNLEEARWQSPIGDAPKDPNDPLVSYRWDEDNQVWIKLN